MDFFFKGMDFECSRCQILGEVYDRIKFECVQCKNFKCYNCSRMNRGVMMSEYSLTLIIWQAGSASTATSSISE